MGWQLRHLCTSTCRVLLLARETKIGIEVRLNRVRERMFG